MPESKKEDKTAQPRLPESPFKRLLNLEELAIAKRLLEEHQIITPAVWNICTETQRADFKKGIINIALYNPYDAAYYFGIHTPAYQRACDEGLYRESDAKQHNDWLANVSHFYAHEIRELAAKVRSLVLSDKCSALHFFDDTKKQEAIRWLDALETNHDLTAVALEDLVRIFPGRPKTRDSEPLGIPPREKHRLSWFLTCLDFLSFAPWVGLPVKFGLDKNGALLHAEKDCKYRRTELLLDYPGSRVAWLILGWQCGERKVDDELHRELSKFLTEFGTSLRADLRSFRSRIAAHRWSQTRSGSANMRRAESFMDLLAANRVLFDKAEVKAESLIYPLETQTSLRAKSQTLTLHGAGAAHEVTYVPSLPLDDKDAEEALSAYHEKLAWDFSVSVAAEFHLYPRIDDLVSHLTDYLGRASDKVSTEEGLALFFADLYLRLIQRSAGATQPVFLGYFDARKEGLNYLISKRQEILRQHRSAVRHTLATGNSIEFDMTANNLRGWVCRCREGVRHILQEQAGLAFRLMDDDGLTEWTGENPPYFAVFPHDRNLQIGSSAFVRSTVRFERGQRRFADLFSEQVVAS